MYLDTWDREYDRDFPLMVDDLKDTLCILVRCGFCFNPLLLHKELLKGGPRAIFEFTEDDI